MFLTNIFNKKRVTDNLTNRDLDKMFDKFLSDNNISPRACVKYNVCKEAVYKLAAKIKSFEYTYNYVPNKAYTILSKLSLAERTMIVEIS